VNELPLLEALAAQGPGYAPRTRHLDPDGRPRYTNRLILETSPYLRQHAHNPVDWRPYGPEVFAEAQTRDVPVFLSSGYSTCHWCHVMEHESFEDPAIAEFLNAHFVPVKLDREEHPDVDAAYMEVLQALTGSGGGWPMSLFLTPDGAPLFAGTYFPARDGERGRRPGFASVLFAIARQWRDPRFAEDGRALWARLSEEAVSAPGVALPGPDVAVRSAAAFRQRFDETWGGFGVAPKFPRPAVLDHLLRLHARTGDPEALQMVRLTLERMACGGLYDHVAGGFARYGTDARWLVPHFEKMLCDNAQLAATYVDAWRVTGDAHFAFVARDVLDWMDREMSAPDGGFRSAVDADSDGEEGLFALWAPLEIDALLPPVEARWVKTTFDVTAAGNFEGRSIPNLRAPLTPEERERWLRARPNLRDARARRVQPLVDDKVVASWNGLAARAFVRAGLAFGEPALVARGARAVSFVCTALRDPERGERLLHCHARGRARHPAVLEDYAATIGACLDLLEATGDAAWLDTALRLQATEDALFADPEAGGYFRRAVDAFGPPLREKPDYDGSEPSGNALSAMNLLRLAEVTGEARYRAAGEATIRALDRLMRVAPTTIPAMLCALDFALGPVEQVVVVGTPAERAPFLERLHRQFAPNRVTLAAAPGDPLCARPLFAGRTGPGVRMPAAYLCRDGACAAPVFTPEALDEALRTRP
jgi:uncharacterized protein YyaL (SSP411 family)